MSCAAPKVQQSSCATENCRYDVFNGHKMLTCQRESFTAPPLQTLASHLHKQTSLVQSTNGAVPGIWGALATTARSRHAAKVLWSSLFLHTLGAPNTTDSRSANNVVPLRKTYMRHVSNGLSAVARPPRGFYQTSTTAAQRLTPTTF